MKIEPPPYLPRAAKRAYPDTTWINLPELKKSEENID
jgi:hypothetical protein